MGILTRLFGRPEAIRVEPTTVVGGRETASAPATIFYGYETLEVVGESHYQEALWETVGGFRTTPVEEPCVAVLNPEPSNPYDRNAIRATINDRLVGYLSREDAIDYLPGLRRLMTKCDTGRVALRGVIVGGGPRPDGVGFLGVFLRHDPNAFGVVAHHISGGTIRTGLHEAIATDLADDSYDLSWLATLPPDDHVTAIELLEGLIAQERELISRHFMFCELETRLYRRRNDDPSALDHFDDACARHDAEMDRLRVALIDKFGVVPVIEMYRQAAIRCQKAKRIADVQHWASRGLEIYGEQAVRAEAVEDLRKRLAYAEQRTLTDAHPTSTPRAASPARPARPRSNGELTTLETLICGHCQSSFERQRTRGRKPKLCPACRGISDTANAS
jgi:hypothetical protein